VDEAGAALALACAPKLNRIRQPPINNQNHLRRYFSVGEPHAPHAAVPEERDPTPGTMIGFCQIV
jgi:hypothetical protein